MDLFGTTGLVILVLAVTLLLVFGMVASRYQKVAPNEVLVIAGRKHYITEDGEKRVVGHRVVKGGGTFVWPVLEKVSKLSLNAMTIDVSNEDAYTRDGVPVIVDSVVIMKIGGDDVSIASAAERFLGFKAEDLQKVAKEVLGGHLRAICSTLSPEEINNNRVAFQQKVLEVAHKDFQNMGLVIDSFTVRRSATSRVTLKPWAVNPPRKSNGTPSSARPKPCSVTPCSVSPPPSRPARPPRPRPRP